MDTPSEFREGTDGRSGQPVRAGRRRFVHGLGAAIPVIMTVRSPSALANTCLSPSASASIALMHSRANRTQGACTTGRSPGFWEAAAAQNHPNHWAWTAIQAHVTPETTYASVFGSSGVYGTHSLLWVLQQGGQGDPYQFGAHLIATYLNKLSGWVPDSILRPDQLVAMWNNGNTTGTFYNPTTSVFWGVTEIKAYLATTWT